MLILRSIHGISFDSVFTVCLSALSLYIMYLMKCLFLLLLVNLGFLSAPYIVTFRVAETSNQYTTHFFGNIYYTKADSRQELDTIVRNLEADRNIEWYEIAKTAIHREPMTNRKRESRENSGDMIGWHIENSNVSADLDIKSAWRAGYSGSGITVRVIDDAVEWRHPMIQYGFNKTISTDVLDEDNDPSPRYSFNNNTEYADEHGTKCAGVIVGQHNGFCSPGIAPNVNFGFCRLLNGKETEFDIANCIITRAANIMLESHSFGPSDNGTVYLEMSRLISEALDYTSKYGNGGKGIINVWASGNGGEYGDDCNADQYQRRLDVISISGVNYTGLPCDYAENCAALFAAVPGTAIATSVIYGDCEENFDGTSAACPVATGVLALVLEANPSLAPRDIQHVIVRGSSWEPVLLSHGWKINGGGRLFHHLLGFGLLKAPTLIKVAKMWKNVGPLLNQALQPILLGGRKIQGNTYTVSFDVLSSHIWFLESVHFSFLDFYTESRGKLSITVYSPSQTPSTLFSNRRRDTFKGYTSFQHLKTNAFWSENPVGGWKVTFTIAGQTNNTVNLGTIKVFLYGTSDNPTPWEYTHHSRFNCNLICNLRHKDRLKRCNTCRHILKEASSHLREMGWNNNFCNRSYNLHL